MMHRTAILFLFLASIFQTHNVFSKVRLPQMVADSMVIQRDTKVKIWGWADAREKIKIKFKGKSYSATARADGSWLLWLPPSAVGGPYTMDITGKDNSIRLTNILIGDVWLCAGQSNMVHYLELHRERYAGEIASANFPKIRQFTVPVTPALAGPAKDVSGGRWMSATQNDILHFSVVAYFFAKKLYQQYQVPIGLINARIGRAHV